MDGGGGEQVCGREIRCCVEFVRGEIDSELKERTNQGRLVQKDRRCSIREVRAEHPTGRKWKRCSEQRDALDVFVSEDDDGV